MPPDTSADSNSDNKSSSPSVDQGKALLTRYNDDEVHDLICVGFGPASLAIAVALHDAIEKKDATIKTHKPKVRFLERQDGFAWHAGMLLPGTRLQISFIKDLATLRDPRSHFTFLNYLHEKDRLVSFTNLGTFLPLRLEYEDYLRWCANHFADVVDYGQTVETIEPGSKDTDNGVVQDFVAKHVVVAVGGRPHLPTPFDIGHPRAIHSSGYATTVPKLFSETCQPKSIAIVGSGQSAAEVFHDVVTRFPAAKCFLLIRGSALRPSDDSPFVNEIFDPERVDPFYSQAPDERANSIAADKATNYGVVRPELLETIYSTLYSHRIQYKCEHDWPQRILTHTAVVDIEGLPPNNKHAIRLCLKDERKAAAACNGLATDHLDVDLVVLASGYARDSHKPILKAVEHLTQGCSPTNDDGGFGPGRNYALRFRKGAVAPEAGIWLQGCNESTHGLSDTLLSILSTRGGELVNSIFGKDECLS